MLLLSMFVWPKMGYVQEKIGLTGQFDQSQPGNYLQPWYGYFLEPHIVLFEHQFGKNGSMFTDMMLVMINFPPTPPAPPG